MSELLLIKAASQGKLEKVRELLAAGHDVNERGEPLTDDELKAAKWVLNEAGTGTVADMVGRTFDITPLMAASESGSLEIIETLLKTGADVKATDSLKRTALMIAIEWKHEEIALRLIEDGSDPNCKDLSGDPPLTQAANTKLWKVGHALLDAGANAKQRTKKYSAPLLAASTGKGEAAASFISRLLDGGAKPNDPVVFSNVVECGHLGLIRRLVEGFPDIASDIFPGRLLEVAAKLRNLEMINTLLECGVVPTNDTNEISALSAVIMGPPRSSLELHSLKFMDNKREIACLETLVNAGADINHVRPNETPALHDAILLCRSTLCRWLLEHGADPNISSWGKTQLEYAKERLEKTQATHLHDEDDEAEIFRQQNELKKIIVMLEEFSEKPNGTMSSVSSAANASQDQASTPVTHKEELSSTPPTPLADRRGLCDKTFSKAEQTLILADIDQISDVLQKDSKIEHTERDVFDRLTEFDKPVGGIMALVKFKGHKWVYVAGGLRPKGNEPMKSWSKSLKSPVLNAGEQSTAGVVFYSLYENGKCIEAFESDGQWFRGGVEIDPDFQDESERMHGTIFKSSRQTVEETDWSQYESEYDFLESLLCEQDAYLTFVWAGFQQADKPLVITAYNEDEISPENIERVDLVFYKPTEAQQRRAEQPAPKDDTLLQAIQAGDTNAVQAAITSGVDLNVIAPGSNSSYLLIAIRNTAFHQNEEIVDILLTAGADPNFGGTEPLLPALVHVACQETDLRSLAKLLEAGADVNARTSKNEENPFLAGEETALMEAASNGKLDYVKLLLKHGADSAVENTEGRTALDYASNWLRNVKKDQLKEVPSFTNETDLANAETVVDLLESAAES